MTSPQSEDDEVEHIAVSPPEYMKVHAEMKCPKCNHVFNPNRGYDLYPKSEDDDGTIRC